MRPTRGRTHGSCLLFNCLALNSPTRGHSRGLLSLTCSQHSSGKSIIWHHSVTLQRRVFQALWAALLYVPAVPRGWRACRQSHAQSSGARPRRWQHGEEAGHRGALELVFGPCGAQVTRGVCGMRPDPDPAEGGLGLSSGLSVLSPQPWNSQPRVSPALVRLQPAPRAKLVGAAAVKGE